MAFRGSTIFSGNAWSSRAIPSLRKTINNCLQGGDHHTTTAFTLVIKNTTMCVEMRVGQKEGGGWRPYHSTLFLADTEFIRPFYFTPGSSSRQSNYAKSWFDLPRSLFQSDFTPLGMTQWLSALESFVAEYLRVTKQFPLSTFAALFHLALISEDGL
jgi:hypothetical protein